MADAEREQELTELFWKELAGSPFVMIGLQGVEDSRTRPWTAQIRYADGADKKDVATVWPSDPITVTIQPLPVSLAPSVPEKGAIKVGGEMTIPVKIERKNGYEGPVAIDLLQLSASPTIVGATSGETMYVITTANGVMHYGAFADFVAALSTSLNGSTRIVRFTATGSYDAVGNTVTARAAAAILK